MGELTDNFDRSEFACKCGCGFDTVDIELIGILEILRETFGNKLIINSGCRCLAHNTKIGGSKKSYHMWGQAVDFYIVNTSMMQVASFLSTTFNGVYGIEVHDNFIHLDIREIMRRVDHRTEPVPGVKLTGKILNELDIDTIQ